MSHLIVSLILASLLMPSGFNFFTQKAVSHNQVDFVVPASIAPKRIITNSLGVETTSASVIVVDHNSNSVLYNKDFLKKSPIASITKLMTALVVLDSSPDWNKVVEIQSDDQRPGGQVYLLTGETVTLDTLFNLMLVSSSNEAAIALSRFIDPDNFVDLMNAKAKELGMTQTSFVEPSGLNPSNISTPNDLVILANTAFGQEKILQAVKTKDYYFTIVNSGRKGHSATTNYLLNSFLDGDDYEIIGAKTGFLSEAGYCLLMNIKKDGQIVTLVLLGADTTEDRWQEAKGLIDWVYRSYQWPN